MHWFACLVLGGKLHDTTVLTLERASNRGSGSPMYEPFVKVWSSGLRNCAGIDYAGVCELIVSDQEDG